jgi:hypothetical protein
VRNFAPGSLSFLCLLAKSIRYSIRGIPFQDLPPVASKLRVPTIELAPTDLQWLPLPPYLNLNFYVWSSFRLAWLSGFEVRAADPDIFTHDSLTNRDQSIVPLLKVMNRTLVTHQYQAGLPVTPFYFQVIEPFLCSPLVSKATIKTIPLGIAAHHIPPKALSKLGLQCKLCLPIQPLPCDCSCGKPQDICGDNCISCPPLPKAMMHNCVPHALDLVLSNMAPLAKITAASTDSTSEPMSLLPQFLLLSPADVSICLLPKVFLFLTSFLTLLP